MDLDLLFYHPVPESAFCIFCVITPAFITLNNLVNCVTSLLILFFRSLMNTSPWDSMVIFFQ